MNNPKILTPTQVNFLKLFGKTTLSDKFYLTGGTALAEFYIPYRFSEDLDFFSENEVDTQGVITFIHSTKKNILYKKINKLPTTLRSGF